MSFKCSVFGHRYGDPDVKREREEQGSEVVITIKETETCKRCGETRIVSENKEVTTLETPSDIVGDDIDDEDGGTTGEPAVDSEPDTTADVGAPDTDGDAEFIDSEASPPAEPAGTEPDQPVPEPSVSADDPPDADEDDAVILEDGDEEEETERKPGQWPDDTTGEDDDDWAPATGDDLQPVEDEQPDIESTNSAVTVPEGEFYCPECDFTTDVESSSLRAGDFCPECHRGSLTHRSKQA